MVRKMVMVRKNKLQFILKLIVTQKFILLIGDINTRLFLLCDIYPQTSWSLVIQALIGSLYSIEQCYRGSQLKKGIRYLGKSAIVPHVSDVGKTVLHVSQFTFLLILNKKCVDFMYPVIISSNGGKIVVKT